MISPVLAPIETPAAGARGPRDWWRRLPPARRRLARVLVGLGVLLVLAASVLLARFLTVENAERNDALALLEAQVRGDTNGMLDQLSGCRASPACVAGVKADASNPHLRHSGAVKILQLESPTAYSLSGATGRTRVAWTVLGSLPVVQCVDVRRSGNFLSGVHVHLIALSAPIPGEGKCKKETTLEKEEEESTAVELGK